MRSHNGEPSTRAEHDHEEPLTASPQHPIPETLAQCFWLETAWTVPPDHAAVLGLSNIGGFTTWATPTRS